MPVKPAVWSSIFAALMSLSPLTAYAVAEGSTEPERPLVMGLLPSISPVSLFKRFSPLVDYINSSLKSNIVLETAPNFGEFQKRTGARMYDILLTAPHFVIPALDSGSYELIATPSNKLTAMVVVSKKSKIKSIADLAGKVVATPEAEALVTKAGVKLLENQGLTGGQQPVYMALPTHNAAYQSVLGKEADAAIISVNVMNKAIKEGAKLRSIGESEQLPGVGILVAADLPQEFKTNLQNFLLAIDKKPDGRKVLGLVDHPGYSKVTAAEYQPMRVYLTE